MASTAHCLYCFEVLAASLEKRPQLSLRQVENSWNQYLQIRSPGGASELDHDEEMTQDEEDSESSDDELEEPESDEEAVKQPTPVTKHISPSGCLSIQRLDRLNAIFVIYNFLSSSLRWRFKVFIQVFVIFLLQALTAAFASSERGVSTLCDVGYYLKPRP